MKFKKAVGTTTVLFSVLALAACSGNSVGGGLASIAVGPTSLNATPLQGVAAGMPGPYTPTADGPVAGAVYVTATLTPISVDSKNDYKIVKNMNPIKLAVIAGQLANGGAYTYVNGLTYALQASSGTINAMQSDGIVGSDRLVQYTIYQDGGAAGAPQGPVRISDTLVLPTHTGSGRALRDGQAVELNGCYYLLSVAAETAGTHKIETGSTTIGGLPAFPDEENSGTVQQAPLE